MNDDRNVDMIQAGTWIKKKPNGITTPLKQRKSAGPRIHIDIGVDTPAQKAFLAKAFMAVLKRGSIPHPSLRA